MGPEGISWSHDNESLTMFDGILVEAALAQLERAYHLNVSFPRSEEMHMDFLRGLDPSIPADAKPYFDWKPPLPGQSQ